MHIKCCINYKIYSMNEFYSFEKTNLYLEFAFFCITVANKFQ